MIIVSFFSYKGGSGRSTTAWNTSYFLGKKLNASPKSPLIIIDMDIDSAGMTILLNAHQKKDKFTVQKMMAMQDEQANDVSRMLLPDISDEKAKEEQFKRHPFFSRLTPVGSMFGLERESVLLFPADISLNGSFTFPDDIEKMFGKIVSLCNKMGCCGIVFDTPSGSQVAASISLGQSGATVCCMRPTYQFRVGTAQYLIDSFNAEKDFHFILCPTAVSKDKVQLEGINLPDDLRYLIKNSVLDKIDERHRKNVNEKMVSNEMSILGIPEVALFKWEECCLGMKTQREPDEELAVKCYQYLADLVLEQCEKNAK